MAAPTPYNLLALSDVHLGSDLVHHVRPDAPRRTRASERCDRELAALFDWYRQHRVDGRPWRLVINGDFIDFAGMAVMAEPGDLRTAPTPEELSHGLGGTPDHTLEKLRLVFEHHAPVMNGLAAFVAAGNTLVIVRGNHDADWHWGSVRREFRRRLRGLARIPRGRLRFSPWFYYEQGVVYLEHGHQYDAYCSYDHQLYPISPGDRRRTARSLSDVLLRYVVRPTRGMLESGHDVATARDYLRFAGQLGISGGIALARRFARANRALFALWRGHLSSAAARVRAVHERRMRRLSVAYRISLKRLRRLARLQHPPITRSLRATLTSVMLDRVLLFLLASLVTAALLVAVPLWMALSIAAGVTAALALLGRAWLSRRTVEPSAALRERASGVAKLFPAAFVVMGHTHLPEMSHAERVTYVNLGAWAEEEGPDGRPGSLPATRTHFVLVNAEDGVKAELMIWDGDGPKPFVERRG